MIRKLLLLLFLCSTILQTFAEIGPEELRKLRGSSNQVLQATRIEIPDKTGFVMLNPDYLVTPGDTYTIHYLYNLKPTTISFYIDSDYSVDLSFFGTFSAEGMNFQQLRIAAENRVLKAYADGLPRVTIDSVGFFPVLVRGEVKVPGYAQAWGFSRLTDIIADRLTPYSSIRDMEIIAVDGTKRTYDLYSAALENDLKSNPIIRPNETIVVNRFEREIFVKGAVYREGAYQILPGENLKTVIDIYSGGFTNLADTQDVYVLRFLTETGSTKTIYLDSTETNYQEVQLRDLDTIIVPNKLQQLPVVFFEGALFLNVGDKSPVAAKIPWLITVDQRISTALNSLPEGAITPVSDLKNAFIIRDTAYIPVDLQKIYYDQDLSGDVALQEGDRIIIPTEFFSVVVGGAVQVPGLQPYVAGKTYFEYIQFAGGFDPELTTGRKVFIYDRSGNRFGTERVIQPEDKIYVPKNSFNYWFTKRVGPIIVTTAAIVSLLINVEKMIDKYRN